MENIPQALLEGMMRGFTTEDFIKKNVYATPFRDRQTGKQTYSLVSSIDYIRKIAAQSGQSGKSEPRYEEDEKCIKSCSITVWRDGGDSRGYTATVFFNEYSTGLNLWKSKPRTMIAKVAEMHALRSAFPNELSQMYTEEEYEKENVITVEEVKVSKVSDELRKKIGDCTTEKAVNELYKQNEGLGKKLTSLVAEQITFIRQANKEV